MKLVGRVTWDGDVLASWRRMDKKEHVLNKTISRDFPSDVQWWRGVIESEDIDRIFVFGSSEWRRFYGSYHMRTIANTTREVDDSYRHEERINGFRQALERGEALEPPILLGARVDGPFMLFDGNHRALAMMRNGCLVGQVVYVGLQPTIAQGYSWCKEAFRDAA